MASQIIPATQPKQANLFLTVIGAWLLVGTLDASGAIINYLVQGNKAPARIFLYIASAVFGKDAYSGGTSMVLTGILFHFMVALLFTIFFFLLSRRMTLMQKHKIGSAILYGIFIWLVMTFLVLPLTKIPPGTVRLKSALIGIAILIIAIGFPLSFIAGTYFTKYAKA